MIPVGGRDMTKNHEVGLTSAEITGLWTTYIGESMSICMAKHMLKYLEDADVKPLLEESLAVSQKQLSEIQTIFMKEKFPIPKGFTEDDYNSDAPALFFNLLPLSFVYGMSRLSIVNYGMIVTAMAREDIRLFFSTCLNSSHDLFNKAITIMLKKGIYDRPAMIPYPEGIEFAKNRETFLSKWFEPQRPLNVLELTAIFFNSERNYFGLVFLTGFIQVVKDERIKKYLIKGKKLAEKQIKFLNDTLTNDDLPVASMINTEISTSTISPFSEKLILNLITMLNSTALTFIGHSLSTSSRVDLSVEYSKLMVEIMQYGKEGMDLLIERQWFEEPPHAPNRKELAK